MEVQVSMEGNSVSRNALGGTLKVPLPILLGGKEGQVREISTEFKEL